MATLSSVSGAFGEEFRGTFRAPVRRTRIPDCSSRQPCDPREPRIASWASFRARRAGVHGSVISVRRDGVPENTELDVASRRADVRGARRSAFGVPACRRTRTFSACRCALTSRGSASRRALDIDNVYNMYITICNVSLPPGLAGRSWAHGPLLEAGERGECTRA